MIEVLRVFQLKALPRLALPVLLFCLLAVQGHTATNRGIAVDIRASETLDAPIAERIELYEASHALVIGIDSYHNGWPRLSNAVKDARLVAEALEHRGFDVNLVLDPKGDELRVEMRRFFAIKGNNPQARLFLWFAGHGHTEFGEGYLVPADAPPPGGPEFLLTALHMGDIGSMVRIAKAVHVFSVFDSCFAGTIFSTQRSRPPAAITKVAARPVRQFLTSGDADQEVSDDGTFRELFLRSLRGEERADLNNDGYLTGTELSLHLENRVTNLTAALQTPRGGKLRDPRFDQGDFVFTLPKPETPEEDEISDGTQIGSSSNSVNEDVFDLEFWNSIKSSTSADTYEAYLEAFPNGRFAPLARLRSSVYERIAQYTTDDGNSTDALKNSNGSDLIADGEKGQTKPRDPAAEQEAALPPVTEGLPDFSVRPVDARHFAQKGANVRAGPSTDYPVVSFLARGQEAQVTGRVVGRSWLRVRLRGNENAFVHASLLGENAPDAIVKSEEPISMPPSRIEDSSIEVAETPVTIEPPQRTPPTEHLDNQTVAPDQPTTVTSIAGRRDTSSASPKVNTESNSEAGRHSPSEAPTQGQEAGEQVAHLTPPESSGPLKSREEVLAYLADNESLFKRRLAQYNSVHRVALDGVTVPSRVQIRSITLQNLEGDRVFARLDYMVGNGRPQTSDHAIRLFELQWQGGDLEFVGHQ